MKRIKRHKVKKEKPETSTSHIRREEEHDLAHYIHDRVELMHQVFSVLKSKELKAMAPSCVRNIPISDLQELCTEELLGISSKRLCAILDGAEPPSDTESSSRSPSPDPMETISLDSISSDEEILSQGSHKKKKHKHRRRGSRSKNRKPSDQLSPDKSAASRAGLTVLELLELQARARAIRAQLQKEQASKLPSESGRAEPRSSDNEVEIKEEPATVVEISSEEDEKPQIKQLIPQKPPSPKPQPSAIVTQMDSNPQPNSDKVTKRVNDLVITVPRAKQSRKIKLNRTKTTITIQNDIQPEQRSSKEDGKKSKEKGKKEKRVKRKEKKESTYKDGSDHDEITLQLSDSEKMDLLEDLDIKNLDVVSSSSTEDSESDSSSEDNEDSNLNRSSNITDKGSKNTDKEVTIQSNDLVVEKEVVKTTEQVDETQRNSVEITNENQIEKENETEKTSDDKCESESDAIATDVIQNNSDTNMNAVDNKRVTDDVPESTPISIESNVDGKECTLDDMTKTDASEKLMEITNIDDIPLVNDEPDISKDKDSAKIQEDTKVQKETAITKDKALLEGEMSESSLEAFDVRPEVVCISDEEKPTSKKKKKKEKKAKKEKKSKKKKDFRESGDQNFYTNKNNDPQERNSQQFTSEDVFEVVNDKNNKETALIVIDKELISQNVEIANDEKNIKEALVIHKEKRKEIIIEPDEDVYEVLELSDDSSCYEVEGTVLSKEPTAEEIEALSARIDEIERDDVVTVEQIHRHEKEQTEKQQEEAENISWKDRYLDSTKVKKVLTTANIMNALRKKNKELKKKMQDSKFKEVEKETLAKDDSETDQAAAENIHEGSIEHYNTLTGSTKYVDPVPEPEIEETKSEEGKKEEEVQKEVNVVTGEMKKDAKQLLKMYKKLIKYNDMNKPSDPNKKKKKKLKKNKSKDKIK